VFYLPLYHALSGRNAVFYLPLYHALSGRPCLVIGGGVTALRKLRWVLRAGARVKVVTLEAHPEIEAMAANGDLELAVEPYRNDHLTPDLALVICATNDPDVSRGAYDRALAERVLINCVDRPELCTVIFPSIVDRFPVLVAISTMGSAPTLARIVRGWIEARLPPRLGDLASIAESLRDKVKARFPSMDDRKVFWEDTLAGPSVDLVMQGKTEAAKAAIEERLEASAPPRGRIALVGAGPGDPELITLKGLRLLETADVVMYDKLANPALLEYTRRDAERLFVGKQGPKPNDPPDRPKRVNQQGAITDQMVALAKAGKSVVRLKGGDPLIYGRGGEELFAALDAGIDVQIVPGVTAALGAASYAGIPLTHRNVSQSVRFVTGHRVDDDINLDWPEMARSEQTLVIYMGLVGLEKILKRLIEVGRDPDTPVVLVENATLPEQREVFGTLATLPELARATDVSGPTTAIVGEVVGLRAH
jgi:uroporphyrin-III C-methyltransferase/precorrin-2 dehydrogenase/sirohydrochlorin ferrochelatase